MTGRGELIAGRYGLLARVGQAGAGVVWQARDELLGRIVAVRQLPALPDDTGQRDVRAAARLRHPNAVLVHDAVEQGGRYYLVMEHFPARSLAELAEAAGRLTEAAVARIGAQISGALAAAHGKGIAHRDITPANILVGSDGTAKITGFGVSRTPDDGPTTHGEDTGFAADVLSLGATLHAALATGPGRRPKRITVRRRHGPLTGVLLWMQRQDPGDRPTMQAAHEALGAVVDVDAVDDGRPTGARRPAAQPVTTRGASRPARRPGRLVRAAIAAVLLLAAAVPVVTLIVDRGGTVQTAGPPSAGQPVTSTPAAGPPPGTAGSPPPMTTATTSIMTYPTMHAPAMVRTPDPPCVARYHITTVWSGGYLAEITVINKAGAIAGWTIRWALPANHTITNLWDGRLTRRGSAITVTNLDYNGRLPTNGTTVFGLTADAPGSPLVLAGTIPALTCESHPVR